MPHFSQISFISQGCYKGFWNVRHLRNLHHPVFIKEFVILITYLSLKRNIFKLYMYYEKALNKVAPWKGRAPEGGIF